MSKTLLERFEDKFKWMHMTGEYVDHEYSQLEQFLTQELTSLFAEMEEVIGEDAKIVDDSPQFPSSWNNIGYNAAKDEIRTKLQKLKEKYGV